MKTFRVIVTDLSPNGAFEFFVPETDDSRTPQSVADEINQCAGIDDIRSLKIGTTVLMMQNIVSISVLEFKPEPPAKKLAKSKPFRLKAVKDSEEDVL